MYARVYFAFPSLGGGRNRQVRINPVSRCVCTRRELQPDMLVAVVAIRRAQRVDEFIRIGIPEIHPQIGVLTNQVA